MVPVRRWPRAVRPQHAHTGTLPAIFVRGHTEFALPPAGCMPGLLQAPSSHSQAEDVAFSRCVSFTLVRYNATLLLDGSGQLSPGTQHAWRSRWPAAVAALLAHLFMAVCELSAAVEQFPPRMPSLRF